MASLTRNEKYPVIITGLIIMSVFLPWVKYTIVSQSSNTVLDEFSVAAFSHYGLLIILVAAPVLFQLIKDKNRQRRKHLALVSAILLLVLYFYVSFGFSEVEYTTEYTGSIITRYEADWGFLFALILCGGLLITSRLKILKTKDINAS